MGKGDGGVGEPVEDIKLGHRAKEAMWVRTIYQQKPTPRMKPKTTPSTAQTQTSTPNPALIRHCQHWRYHSHHDRDHCPH